MSFQVGDIVGDYQIVGLLGVGGMGKVYKVRNQISDRIDALKVLLPDLADNPDLEDRFVREIKVLASLNHPNIAGLRIGGHRDRISLHPAGWPSTREALTPQEPDRREQRSSVPDLSTILIQLFAGLSRGMVLFLLSAGLSLIFGVMNILNFAHATFWLLAGYITVTIYNYLLGYFEPGFYLLIPAVVAATAIMIVVGLVVERFLIRRMYNRELAEQLLLTFALVLILGDVIKLIWGVENRRIFVPVTPVEAFGAFINPYYFFLIGAGLAVAIGLWAFLHRTKYGKIVRAAVYSREMVSALGIRIPLIYAGVFAAGIGIAAFAAGIFSPLLPMGLGVDIDIIIQCFAVVVIGGFGSILGTFVASLLVGIVYSFSILLWPDGAVAVIFLIVIAVLIWRPWGLFGTELRS